MERGAPRRGTEFVTRLFRVIAFAWFSFLNINENWFIVYLNSLLNKLYYAKNPIFFAEKIRYNKLLYNDDSLLQGQVSCFYGGDVTREVIYTRISSFHYVFVILTLRWRAFLALLLRGLKNAKIHNLAIMYSYLSNYLYYFRYCTMRGGDKRMNFLTIKSDEKILMFFDRTQKC